MRLGLNEPNAKLVDRATRSLAANLDETGVFIAMTQLSRGAAGELREALVKGLEKHAENVPEAAKRARAERAVSTESNLVPVAQWKMAWSGPTGPPMPPEPLTGEALLEQVDQLSGAVRKSPDDAEAQLALARTFLAWARDQLASGQDPRFTLEDADRCASQAGELGVPASKVASIQAQARYLLSEFDAATELAIKALDGLEGEDAFPVIEVLARTQTAAIYNAGEEDWPAEWLSDAHAAFTTLRLHPACDGSHIVAHSDLLGYVGVLSEQSRVLSEGVVRFPTSPDVHSRFRTNVQAARSLASLRTAYAGLRSKATDLAAHDWYTGYAELVLAEDAKRNGRAAESDEAYRLAIEWLQKSAEAEEGYADSVDWFVALALAGRARLAHERKDLDGATELIVAAWKRRPDVMEAEDGLKRKPVTTLSRLRIAVKNADRADLLEQLAVVESSSE